MAASNFREYYLQLYNTRKDRPIDDDTGSFQVYQPATPVRQTIYNAAGTTLTQEVVGTSFLSRTMTDGRIRFFTNHTASSVDVSILTAGGRSYFLKGLTSSDHRVDVDPEKQEYVLVAAFNDKASATTVRPLGFRLRKGMAVNDVIVKVTAAFAGAAAASNRYSVGRSGAALGFANNLTLSAVGFKVPEVLRSSTGLFLTRIRGTDLSFFEAGTTVKDPGMYARKSYLAVTAVVSNNLVVKRQTAATLTHSFTNTGVSGAGKGYIYYFYTLLPTETTAP
jgi:hypothetical protein